MPRPPRLIGLRPGRAKARPCGKGIVTPQGLVPFKEYKRLCESIYRTKGGYEIWFHKWPREAIWGNDYYDAERKRSRQHRSHSDRQE